VFEEAGKVRLGSERPASWSKRAGMLFIVLERLFVNMFTGLGWSGTCPSSIILAIRVHEDGISSNRRKQELNSGQDQSVFELVSCVGDYVG